MTPQALEEVICSFFLLCKNFVTNRLAIAEVHGSMEEKVIIKLFAFLQFCTFCWYNFLRNVDLDTLNKRAANYLRVLIFAILSHSQK